MIDLQGLIDAMSAQWAQERAKSQMTIGGMIAALKAMPAGAQVANLCRAHSYRGYYSDIAFERGEGTRPASDLLSECIAAVGSTLEGYKGGFYRMGGDTPVWVSGYGVCSNDRLMGFDEAGGAVTQKEE